MAIAHCSAALLFIASSAAVMLPAQSQTGQPAYVGRWSYDPAYCKGTGDELPMVVTRKGIQSAQGSCSFRRITGGNGLWRAQIACNVEGMRDNRNLEIRVQGQSMTLTYRDGLRGVDEFKRC